MKDGDNIADQIIGLCGANELIIGDYCSPKASILCTFSNSAYPRKVNCEAEIGEPSNQKRRSFFNAICARRALHRMKDGEKTCSASPFFGQVKRTHS